MPADARFETRAAVRLRLPQLQQQGPGQQRLPLPCPTASVCTTSPTCHRFHCPPAARTGIRSFHCCCLLSTSHPRQLSTPLGALAVRPRVRACHHSLLLLLPSSAASVPAPSGRPPRVAARAAWRCCVAPTSTSSFSFRPPCEWHLIRHPPSDRVSDAARVRQLASSLDRVGAGIEYPHRERAGVPSASARPLLRVAC